jgi:hypothetical protein
MHNSLKTEYLQRGDVNFLAVDWALFAAESFDWVQRYGVPIAGATTGEFLNFLIRETGTRLESIHLIGFSGGVMKNPATLVTLLTVLFCELGQCR